MLRPGPRMADRRPGVGLGMVGTGSLWRDAGPFKEKNMPTPAAKLGVAWMDDNDIRQTLTKIHHNRTHHDAMLRKMSQKLDVHADSVRRSIADAGLPNAKSIVSKAVSGRRNEFARESADARKAYIRELTVAAERVKSAAGHYRSPIQMLMRSNLGSERRSRQMQQVEQSGPVELASLAEFAAAKQDGDLAAALCSRVSAMKANDRPFSPNELAEVICGDLHKELSQALVECERCVLEALQADVTFETGKPNPQRSMQIAMLKKREAEIGAYVRNEAGETEAA